MKPDKIERAHLRDPRDLSHTMHRYPPPPDLTGLVQRFWIPVWSVQPGREAPQRVLQYPCALVVVAQRLRPVLRSGVGVVDDDPGR